MQFTQLSKNMIRKWKLTSLPHISARRCYTDKSKKVDSKSKQLMVKNTGSKHSVKNTGSKHSLVTRRVRPTDVPKVLSFMREHARNTWPGKAAPPLSSHMVLSDYISRILAQGHSLLTEQLEMPYGWTRIRGLALATSYTPWDSTILESFSQCVKSAPAKRLIEFNAHCLRSPGLHEKYRVHNILQVILIVPEHQDSEKVLNSLVNNIRKRGRDGGFPILRFDANCDIIAKKLEEMKLKKEWHMNFKVLPTKIIENNERKNNSVFHNDKISSKSKPEKVKQDSSYVTVFTELIKDVS